MLQTLGAICLLVVIGALGWILLAAGAMLLSMQAPARFQQKLEKFADVSLGASVFVIGLMVLLAVVGLVLSQITKYFIPN